MKIYKGILVAFVGISMLTSCFTGIESTPRITKKDVMRNDAMIASEASEIASRLQPAPISQWVAGRRFLVTDAKVSLLFEKEPKIAPGEIIVFDNIINEISIIGDEVAVLTFHKEDDSKKTPMRYKVGLPLSELPPSFTLPMSVDMDMVDAARKELVGKEFYIITSMRVDSLLTPVNKGRRCVPVRISDVTVGNDDYPLRVDIIDDLGRESSVAMTVGSSLSSTRNFDKIFVLENPRLRYETISDMVWENIVNSRVTPGMTTIECSLAIGTPKDIRKWHNGGSYFEGWVCDNGNYLIFIDGVLSEIH